MTSTPPHVRLGCRRLLTLLWVLAALAVAGVAGACAAPAQDGRGVVIGDVVNTYHPGAASVAAGAVAVPVGASAGAGTPVRAGDLLLVIQMQDAPIDVSNSGAYGDGAGGAGALSGGGAGQHEFAVASGPVSGGVIPLASPLRHAYASAAATATRGRSSYQVVRVPQYASATLASGATALAWNGQVGGVFAVDVAGTLNLGGATVSLVGRGFRGGGGRAGSGYGSLSSGQTPPGTNSDWRAPTTFTSQGVSVPAAFHGIKGEGTAGTPERVLEGAVVVSGGSAYPGGSLARGAPGNAGGGGTDQNPANNELNTGGGGGSGGGAGGSGGRAWVPGGTTALADLGGRGGRFVRSGHELVLGGGGGAGTTNNGTGTPGGGVASSGASGGGIVIIRAARLAGSGWIDVSGAAANSTVTIDGSGGGGGGGSVAVQVQAQTSLSGLTVRAEGGRGGTNTPGSSGAHGPGGGGGGGFVVSSGPLGSGSSVTGGPNGVTATANAYGATPGSAGTIRSSATLSIPGPPPGYACATSNLTLSKTVTNVTRGSQAVTDGTASPGDVLRYVVTFVVGGVLDVTEAVFSDAADLTWVTPSGNAALLCPPRTGQGAVSVPFTPSGGLYVVDVVRACGPLPPGAVGTVAFEVRVR